MSQDLSDEQFKSTKAALNETSNWMANASDSQFIFNKSNRNIGYDGYSQRVNFDGKTTRFKPNTEIELIKSRVASCREAYENAGLVSNAIDLMVDFALENVNIVHENKSIQRFYDKWLKRVNMSSIIEQILKAYFVDSNVPVLSFRGRIGAAEVRKFKSSVASNAQGAQLFIDDEISRKRIIPYKYSVLDVLRLHVEGADLLGNIAFEYDLEPEDRKRLMDPSNDSSADMERLKRAVGDTEFGHLKATGKLRIDPSRISMLYYKRDGYRRWANPYLWRTIEELKFKKILRDMDISVAESVINTFTIIKLGDTPAGFPASEDMFTKFASLLATKTKSPNLIWNDLVSIEAEYPPVEKILGEAKYDQVNKEIRSSLGIPEVILSGAGTGNFANSFLAVKTLVERLEGARRQVLVWLEEQLTIVARAMDFKTVPFIKMDHIDLTDETEQKRLMLEMVDRGMVSYQTCIETFGENYEIEIQRMKQEDKFRRKNEKKFPYTLIKTGKFGPSLGAGPTPVFELLDSETLDARQTQDAEIIRERQKVEVEQLKNPPKLPTEQGSKGDSGGRPANTKKPQKKTSTPRNKPKGQDSSSSKAVASNALDAKTETGKEIFNKIYPAITKAFVKKLGLKDARSLRDIHKEQIFNLIAFIIPEFTSAKEVTNKNVELLLKATSNQEVTSETLNNSYPKLSTEIRDIVRKLISRFKKIHGYPPTKNEACELIASTYAITFSK